ncbi:PadR family transcriptional regulator [Planotetraspora sp. A-T 1434]|uniref:PadR family transcriptional regulator n=1 Tax=Planotetraspora sp. A-T 1434 TaxID=2979219 RepID=UPI0021BFA1E9|nr:PadR family transcriptional regulator [Planotetraspora sp. A-T 1434]MCT9929497.1 PadR family transcriptional regulator [Planotetraspora sp. A-T 1434]
MTIYAMGGPWGFSDRRPPADSRRQMRRALHASFLKGAAMWQHHSDEEHDHHGHGIHHGIQGQEGPHERRHRGGPRGRGPWGGPGGGGFGPGGPFGPGGFPFGGRGFRMGRKAKRGDVRAAILALLGEEPRNGYQIIQEIAARSEGGWKPSPGAVYPALQQLTDEGLVRAEETDGRKTFQLTEAGRAYVAEHPDEVRAPWEDMTPDIGDNVHELFALSRQAASALFQIAQAGTDGQIKQAKQVLTETRRKLYQILADGDPSDE